MSGMKLKKMKNKIIRKSTGYRITVLPRNMSSKCSLPIWWKCVPPISFQQCKVYFLVQNVLSSLSQGSGKTEGLGRKRDYKMCVFVCVHVKQNSAEKVPSSSLLFYFYYWRMKSGQKIDWVIFVCFFLFCNMRESSSWQSKSAGWSE